MFKFKALIQTKFTKILCARESKYKAQYKSGHCIISSLLHWAMKTDSSDSPQLSRGDDNHASRDTRTVCSATYACRHELVINGRVGRGRCHLPAAQREVWDKGWGMRELYPLSLLPCLPPPPLFPLVMSLFIALTNNRLGLIPLNSSIWVWLLFSD